MSDVVRGALDAMRGARFLAARPRLWGWIAAPAVVSLALLIAIVAGAVTIVGPWIAGLVAFLPGAWAETVVNVALSIVLAVLSLTVFLSVAALIAAPFNEMLSERVEEELTGRPGERFRFSRFLRDVVVGVVHAARRVIVYLLLIAAIFVVSFVIPGIGALIATALGAIVTARFASYDAYDAVWARRRWRYREKIAYLRAQRWRTLGLGAAVAALVLVPGLNLVALSIGATGATLAFLDGERASGEAAVARR